MEGRPAIDIPDVELMGVGEKTGHFRTGCSEWQMANILFKVIGEGFNVSLTG